MKNSFVEDGLYDWDILKKQQEQGGSGAIVTGTDIAGAGAGGDRDGMGKIQVRC